MTVLDAMLGRCEAAHDEDRSACEGPPDAVRIVDETQHTTFGCLLHGAVALASVEGARVYPGSVPGGAITVYERARLLQPFEFGHQALARGLFRPPPDTEGSPGDLYDPPPVDEPTCDTCPIPVSRFPVDHPLHVEGSGQCAWCRQADIEEDKRLSRQEDV